MSIWSEKIMLLFVDLIPHLYSCCKDILLYRKSKEKEVSCAARSLLNLFREVNPSLLNKRDRGRPSDQKTSPKAFGEVHVSSCVPGLELLEQDDGDGFDERDGFSSGSDNQDCDGTSLMQKDSNNESYGDEVLDKDDTGVDSDKMDGDSGEINKEWQNDLLFVEDNDSFDADEMDDESEYEFDGSIGFDDKRKVDLQDNEVFTEDYSFGTDDYKNCADDNVYKGEKEHGTDDGDNSRRSKTKKTQVL